MHDQGAWADTGIVQQREPVTEQDLRDAEMPAGFAELVRQLVRVGGDVVETRQHHQADEAAVDGRRRLRRGCR